MELEQHDRRSFLDDPQMEGTCVNRWLQDHGYVERRKERQTYPQNWPAYNETQKREKLLFLDILDELCSLVPVEKQIMGRPRAPLPEMVFSCVLKVYELLSSRRVNSDLDIARRMGYLSRTPHYNTVLKYFNDPRFVPILTNLIQLSALPLKDLEHTFAVDASGLSSAFYSRWLDYRFNGDKRIRDWLKVHLICGAKTNIVTHVVKQPSSSRSGRLVLTRRIQVGRTSKPCGISEGFLTFPSNLVPPEGAGVAKLGGRCFYGSSSTGKGSWNAIISGPTQRPLSRCSSESSRTT